MNRMLLGYSPDFDVYDEVPAARPSVVPVRAATTGLVFDAATTMMLAAELLESDTESEFEAGIRTLIRRAGASVGHLVDAPTGAALTRLLRRAARMSMPGLPSLPRRMAGIDHGAALAAAPKLPSGAFFGLALEGLSPEDQEFEAAKAFVMFAGDAARNAALSPLRLPAASIARVAADKAAQRHAPGWLRLAARRRIDARAQPARSRSGRIEMRRRIGAD